MTHYELIQTLAKQIRHGVITFDKAVTAYRQVNVGTFLIPVPFYAALRGQPNQPTKPKEQANHEQH